LETNQGATPSEPVWPGTRKFQNLPLVRGFPFINPPGHLNRQLRCLQDIKDIDKVILHFKQFSEVFTTRRWNIGYHSLKI
jgi:hypothetical protein